MDILHYEFMRNAILAAVLASVACGIIGSYVVVKKIVSISGSIAHSAFGGIGLGYFLGLNPIVVVVPFTLCFALGMGVISKRTRISPDTAIGIFWAFGMAIGIIFINLTPGYVPDLFSYLFGNILTVPRADILMMLVLDFIILIFVFSLYKEFLAVSFDEEYSATLGMPVERLYYILLCLIALTIVLLIKIVGIVLVIALLTIPAAIAKQHTSGLRSMMLLSIVIGVVFMLGGLWLSYFLDIASGATIIILSTLGFIASSGYKMVIKKIGRTA
ncbi:MAG: metal ABC transporter permease [Candidatus Omnitrophica bacterium]|nr:metal ABC transporter permease [Candidatus Omnitrophota bacterium]